MRGDSPQESRSRHCRAVRPILNPLIPGCSVAGDQDPSRFPFEPEAAWVSGMQARRTEAETFRAAPSGRRIPTAEGCASSLSNPACCFSAVWPPAARGQWR